MTYHALPWEQEHFFLIQKNNFLMHLRITGYNLYNQDEFTSIIRHNLY